MDSKVADHLQAIKAALLELDDTGDVGFEGFIAAVLTSICGQPFRLASSGSQGGRDGESALDDGATYFEAKLYDGKVPRSTVADKLLEIAIDDVGKVDTFVLGTTSAISTQHARFYKDAVASHGIGIVLLDWPSQKLPPFAAALLLAPDVAKGFLRANVADVSKVDAAAEAIDALAADKDFCEPCKQLGASLREPAVGFGLAKAGNKAWFEAALSSRILARRFFGQPLALLDQAGLAPAPRLTLTSKLRVGYSGPPDASVYAVIGDEGAGKSWLAAQSWLNSVPQPVLVMFVANELEAPRALFDLESVLIEKLCAQTNDMASDASRLRWRRRFEGWRANPASNVRLAVVVDGLNQAPQFPWPHWIDAASKFLHEIGGRLIVTTRATHFAQRLRDVVVSTVKRVIVEDWTEEELKDLLALKGVVADRLSADVFHTLRNPRILGIAAELLDSKDIERFEELSVDRLLFEHVRRCERDGLAPLSARAFAKALREYANTIISRISSQQHDDLKVLDLRLHERLGAVSSSRFFEPVPGDDDLYTIRDEGLPLALALWLINALQIEHRNHRDPAARLAVILEPVLTLERTSEVIFSSITVAFLGGDCPLEVTTALLRYYINLQNLPEDQEEPFMALATTAPEAYVLAARDASLSKDRIPNIGLLTDALLRARNEPSVATVLARHLPTWLSYYSLAPERMMFKSRSRDSKEEVESERAKREADISSRLEGLSDAERQFIELRLVRHDEGALEDLHRFAFSLLAGLPLAPYAEFLLNWAFSNALNSAIYAPHNEFAHLVHFNGADWSATREALVKACGELEVPGASRTAEWAIVGVLRATGASTDAERASIIVERLTCDRPLFSEFSLLERYCASDPCDPTTEKPDNLAKTAAEYAAIDLAQLRTGLGHTKEDHFFSMARAGLARFEPDVAIGVHRQLAHAVLRREELAFRQGAIWSLSHSAVLDRPVVDGLIAKAMSLRVTDKDAAPSERDEWLGAQYGLFAALAHLNGNQQLAAIAAMSGTAILVSLLEATSPADEAVVEEWLERVLRSGDHEAQVRVLCFVLYSGSSLSSRSQALLLEFISSKDRTVRVQALGIIATSRAPALLKAVVEAGWDAKWLDPDKDRYELWHGSSILLSAAERKLIAIDAALDRMSFGFLGFAAKRLGAAGARLVSARIDAALRRALEHQGRPSLPRIVLPVPVETDTAPPLLSLIDDPAPRDMKQLMERMNESQEEFAARQRRAWQVYDRLSKELTAADARLIVERLSPLAVEAMLAADPSLVAVWSKLLDAANEAQLRWFHGLLGGLAKFIASTDPAAAVLLLRKMLGEPPLIDHVLGAAKIPEDSVVVWSTAQVEEVKRLAFERLDMAPNDRELAVEVLAAFSRGMDAQIKEYVDGKLATGEPAKVARALMVSGFSNENSHAEGTLLCFSDTKGFLAAAYKAAKYAYDRNCWAKHWYAKMCSARDSAEFWASSIVFTKIVDGRYALWHSEQEANANAVFKQFAPTVEQEVVRRIEKWGDKRKDKLFGETAPEPHFVHNVLAR